MESKERMMERNGIYDVRRVIEFDQVAISAIHSEYPDIKSIVFDFYLPPRSFKIEPHYPKSLTIVFVNGNELEINGTYLYKFIKRVPVNLADHNDPYEYAHASHFHDILTPEQLAELARYVFLVLTKEHETYEETRPLRFASIEYGDDTYTATQNEFPSIIPDVTNPMVEDLLDLADEKDFMGTLSDWARTQLLKPRLERSFEKIDSGDLYRPSFKEIEWGQVNGVTFRSFLAELDPERDNGAPYYRRYSDRYREFVRDVGISLLQELYEEFYALNSTLNNLFCEFARLSKQDGTTPQDIVTALYDSPRTPFATTLEKYFDELTEGLYLTDLLTRKYDSHG